MYVLGQVGYGLAVSASLLIIGELSVLIAKRVKQELNDDNDKE